MRGRGKEAARKGSKQDPTIIAVFTHKGGTGKTTLTANLGAMLAKQGHRTILVDADPQMSLTTQYAEGGLVLDEPSDWEYESDEGDLGPTGADTELVHNFAHGAAAQAEGPRQLTLPPLTGDRTAKPDAMRAEDFSEIRKWCQGKHNLFDALNRTVTDERFVAKPTVVNGDDYKGRLMLLPGSGELHSFTHSLECNDTTNMSTRYSGSFRKAMVAMAHSVDATFVLVDLGPHTDKLHKVMIMSADAIQPVVAFCIYSCFSTFNFLRLVLPDWITWAEGMSSKQAPEGYAYTKQLPRILPFLGLNYEMKKGSVIWSGSNFFETLKQIIAFNDVGSDLTEHAGETRRRWEQIKALYVPFKKGKEALMVLPFIKHLTYISVAQECGRAFFDLTEKALQDYFHAKKSELNVNTLNEEKTYVEQRLKRLSGALVSLHHALAKERQQLKAASAPHDRPPSDEAGPSNSRRRLD